MSVWPFENTAPKLVHIPPFRGRVCLRPRLSNLSRLASVPVTKDGKREAR